MRTIVIGRRRGEGRATREPHVCRVCKLAFVRPERTAPHDCHLETLARLQAEVDRGAAQLAELLALVAERNSRP